MKKTILIIGLIVALVLVVGCAKDITQAEAQTIAQQYVINEVRPSEPIVINNVFLTDGGWHAQLTVGDDKATIIISKKGEVERLHTYGWI